MFKKLFKKKEKILIEPKLKKFLWRNRALRRFKRNVRNDALPYGKGYIYHCIDASFFWKNAPEKVLYWANLSVKYHVKKSQKR